MRAGNRDQRQDQHSIAEVPEAVAEPEARRQQPPEGGIGEPPGIGPVADAGDREGREYRAGEDVKPVQVDHGRAVFALRASERSNQAKRAEWMMNAAIAVGIAHTDNWNGVS